MSIIEQFFERVKSLKIQKDEKLREYIESAMVISDTYSNEFSVVKSKSKPLGLDDLLAANEGLYNQYDKLNKEYNAERIKCINKIKEINDHIYELILIYSFIDYSNDKDVIYALNRYHKIYYAESYFRKLKSKAIKKLEKLLNEKRNKEEQKGTKWYKTEQAKYDIV